VLWKPARWPFGFRREPVSLIERTIFVIQRVPDAEDRKSTPMNTQLHRNFFRRRDQNIPRNSGGYLAKGARPADHTTRTRSVRSDRLDKEHVADAVGYRPTEPF
jgi:hypothetical protein